MLPSIIFMTMFIVYPLCMDVFYSFTSKHLIMPKMRFVGFRNYYRYLQDPIFWTAVKNGVIWTVASVSFQLFLGLVTALILNMKLKGIAIARGLIILPWITPMVVVVIVWKWIFNDLYGIVNYILVGIGLIPMGTSFFSSPSLAMPTAIAMNVWWGYPFMTIVLLAGLKGIDQTLYEAARVDGASAVQEFFNITLPGLWPYIAIAVLLRGMWIFTFFDPIWLLTRGGPTYKTLIIPIMAYLDTFTSYQLGKGCALVVMLLIIQLIYLIFFFKVYKYEEVDER